MSITRDDAFAMIGKLARECDTASIFLTPYLELTLDAELVFDTIREQCDPPMTKEEFDAFVTELEDQEE